MDTRLNAAVIGCGRMGAFTSAVMLRHAAPCWFPLNHAEAMRRHPRVRLAAVCDVDAGAAERAALAHGATAYDEPRALFDALVPDLLGIATRTVGRADLLEEALERGCRALHVEKPLCNDVAEWERLARALAPDTLYITYGALRRHLAPYRQAVALASSATVGPLREVRVDMGPGTLYWTHAHSVDLLLFAAADRRVTGVQARLTGVDRGDHPAHVRSDPGVAWVVVHFDDGLVGTIGQAQGYDLTLSCDGADVAVRNDGRFLELRDVPEGDIYPAWRPLPASADSTQAPGGTLAPVSQLVDCLSGDAWARTANRRVKQDILFGQRLLFAIVQSHLEGSRLIAPESIDPTLRIDAVSGGRHA